MNDIALAQATQAAAKKKFRGHTVLKSKVKPHFPQNLSREYMRITNTYMTLIHKILEKHLPELKKQLDGKRETLRADDVSDTASADALVSQTFLKIRSEFSNQAASFGLDEKLSKLAAMTQKLSIKEWKKACKETLGINILDDYYMGEFYRDSLRMWTQNNVDLITSIDEVFLSDVENVIYGGFTSGRTNAAIGKEISEVYGVSRRKGQFIARDQIAKLNADITKSQQTDAGIEEYVWSTSGDARVRDRHEQLDGKRFRWDNPPVVDEETGRTANPGEDYNCRCVALPVFNLPTLNLPWEKGEVNG